MPFRVLIESICYGSYQRCEITPWVVEAYTSYDPRQVQVTYGKIDQLYVESARNRACSVALDFDALVQIDTDMIPAPGFFQRAVDFLRKHPGSVAIGSPYCGSPAVGCGVHVMRTPDGGSTLVPVTRAEAARATGIELVGAVGTGLFAMNTAALRALSPPYFVTEFTDSRNEIVSCSEDFAFCRKLTRAGGRVYVDWNSWSGHDKRVVVGKPEPSEV
jgi:hypothetical protein